MERAWARSSNGVSKVEATFLLNGSSGNYTVRDAPQTNESMKQNLSLQADDFALFHVHPNGSIGPPSETDINLANDLFSKGRDFIIYTFGNGGLWAYDPKIGGKPQLLREGLDWLRPCQ